MSDNERAIRLICDLYKFAFENGGIPSCEDWETGKMKYYIAFSHAGKGFSVIPASRGLSFPAFHFNDKNAAERAIEKFHDELIWYFTEYEVMLR